jgi:hypothetical protein
MEVEHFDPPTNPGVVYLVLSLLHRSRAARLVAGAYLLESLFWLIAGVVPGIPPLVLKSSTFLWLFGPPINLIHGVPYWWQYLLGSIVCGGAALGVVRTHRRWLSIVAGFFGVLGWCASGLMVYAPLI